MNFGTSNEEVTKAVVVLNFLVFITILRNALQVLLKPNLFNLSDWNLAEIGEKSVSKWLWSS